MSIKSITINFLFALLSLSVFLLVACSGKPPIPTSTSTPTIITIDEPVNSPLQTLPKCNVNVYIENSASMDGYVKGVTEFEQAVYSYISDIKLLDFCQSLNLNYINSTILKQPDDVSDFIEKLEPSSFKQKGGNRSTTDIANLFKAIMDEQGPEDVSILISDFVFSPGKKDASQYLTNQQIGIKSHFATKLKEDSNYAAILYRLVSHFDGYYFNKFDDSSYIQADRPFFIWILGSIDQLQRLEKCVDQKNMKGKGVDHSYSISRMNEPAPYGILPKPRIGSFDIDRKNPKTSILKAKIDKRDKNLKFSVSFGVDYSHFLLEDSYLEDTSNYEVNNKAYSLEISKNTNATSSYTHIIKLILKPSQPVISRGTIKVSLLKKSAKWADEMTDENGENIFEEGAMDKTFGLKNLVEGVYDAYKVDNTYSVFTINIQ